MKSMHFRNGWLPAIVTAMAGWGTCAWAQQEVAAAPASAPERPRGIAPREPLVAGSPSRAEWTVRYTHDFNGSWESSDSWAQASEVEVTRRKVRSIRYSKDAGMKTLQLTTKWSDGTSEDEWIVMGTHVAERAGGRGLYVVGAEQTTAKQLAASDFPELSWVEASHYKGVKVFKGRQVFAFGVAFDQKRLSPDEARHVSFAQRQNPGAKPSEILKPKVPAVVLYLDAKTQLPVLYNDGTVIRQYDFDPTPTSRLRPPQRIMDFLRARAAFLKKRLTVPAGPGSS